MSLWRQLSRGLRALVNRSAADRDIADEVQQYIDDAAAAFEASGLSPEDARRAARRQLGSVTAVHEQVRAHGWEHIVETTLSDIRHAARRIRRYPVRRWLLPDAGARHRREHRDFQRRQSGPLRAAALSRLGTPDVIWDNQGGSRLDVTFGTYPRAQRADSLVRVDGRDAPDATDADRRRRA